MRAMLLLAGLLLAAQPALAQTSLGFWLDTFESIYESPSGQNMLEDIAVLTGGMLRFDYNNDGVPELITTSRGNDNVVEKMQVTDAATGAMLIEIDIREMLMGPLGVGQLFSEADFENLRFMGFYPWALPCTPGSDPQTKSAFFIAAGAPIVLSNDGSEVTAEPPTGYRVLALIDTNGDGTPEIALRDKQNDRIVVYESQCPVNNPDSAQ